MVNTGAGPKNTFRAVEQIILEEIQIQSHGYFGLLGIVNYVDPLPSPLTLSALTQLSDNGGTSAVGIQNFFDRLSSDIIAKAIEG